MRGRVDQLVAGFADGDAISQEARFIRSTLRGMGLESDIFAPAESIGPGLEAGCGPLGEYVGGPDDILLYHYSTASSAGETFLASPTRRIVRYHNITPAEYFVGYDDALATRLREARSGLGRVVGAAECVWSDSRFNADEAQAAGASRGEVLPLFFNTAEWEVMPDPAMTSELGGGLRNVLFVGRIAPNKCVEELILAFAWYHRTIEPRSRLVLVGSDRSCPRYYAMLRLLAARLDLPNVYFKGFLSREQLAACYREADLFVCASRHEGYCLPLLEAMAHGVPVAARDIGGMPEAMGGAGVRFDDTEPRVLAELMHELCGDGPLRAEVLAAQQRRIETLRNRNPAEELGKWLGL